MKNQSFLPSTGKKSACKRKQESPQEKKDSKQHGSLMHSKSKTSQSLHMKMKIQSQEQGLPGIAQMKLLTSGFEEEPLLTHWIQVVAPHTAH